VAVTLRLARHGVKAVPHYRIVATPKGSKRDGRFLEVVGTYNPMLNPPRITLKEDRVRHWIEQGAQVTSVVRDLVRRTIPGFIEGREQHQLKKLQAARKARKTRSKSDTKAAKPKKAAKK
jgi:small subunit ribosomal protein S16